MNVAHATLGTERRFARTAQMKLSPIKEIELAASRIPGVVSLAQGIPSFDTPEPIKAFVQQKIAEGACAKYSLTPGLPQLRELIAESLLRDGMHYDPDDEIIVTCGSIEGIASTLLTLTQPGDEVILPPFTFFATAGVQTDKTSEALTEFFKELDAILKPVPADELERARNYVALRFPGTFETTGDMSRRLEDMIVFHLPDDYFSKYVQNIRAIAPADAQRVAQKYILPTRVAVVVVGDRKTIEPGLRALNLGPIKVMTIDEVFGPPPTP
jgi:hypothetical protein